VLVIHTSKAMVACTAAHAVHVLVEALFEDNSPLRVGVVVVGTIRAVNLPVVHIGFHVVAHAPTTGFG